MQSFEGFASYLEILYIGKFQRCQIILFNTNLRHNDITLVFLPIIKVLVLIPLFST